MFCFFEKPTKWNMAPAVSLAQEASVQKLWNLGLRRGRAAVECRGGGGRGGTGLTLGHCIRGRPPPPLPSLCVPIQPAATDIPSTRPKKSAPCRLARRLILRLAFGIRFLSATGGVFTRSKGDHIRCFDCKSCCNFDRF